VSQAGTVTRLALRELWISFRLLLILVAFVGVGAAVALLPAPASVSLERVAVGFGAATAMTAAMAAWSLSDERTSGRAGWLVTRSVARGTYLLGWFAALGGVALVGITASAGLTWLAVGAAAFTLQPVEYAAACAGIAAAVCAAIALGLVAGCIARPPLAAVLAVGGCACVAAVTLLLPDAATWSPGGAHLALAEAAASGASVAPALRAAGTALVLAALLLSLARMAFERAEL
jgi:hypothetical protein